MTNNDIFDRLCSALKLNDADVMKCFTLVERAVSPEITASIDAMAEPEVRPRLTDTLFADFLDGLIIARRGPGPSGNLRNNEDIKLTNNMILKKLRIALNLQAEDMLERFELGGKTLAHSELTVLFRKPTNKHYKACNDELLSAFLEGVAKSQTHQAE